MPFGDATAKALDRYVRSRRSHRLADSPVLWLGDRGKGFTYYALYSALRARAEAGGVEGFHPHRLRHTGAHRWSEQGGSESGLMTVAGWSRPDITCVVNEPQEGLGRHGRWTIVTKNTLCGFSEVPVWAGHCGRQVS